ncbi:hypothetical protein NVP1293O_54 [Vibrio phage 1.293.O._10N.261.52.E1]|nr:hypothetical protein NVP1293O_54 [Vibrio phage 1.293.O._10N.261.52.E1]
MELSELYVGKPVRITDPELVEDVGETGADYLVGYVWDIEEDDLTGYQFIEVLITTEWELGSSKFLVPYQDYVMSHHLEEIWLN